MKTQPVSPAEASDHFGLELSVGFSKQLWTYPGNSCVLKCMSKNPTRCRSKSRWFTHVLSVVGVVTFDVLSLVNGSDAHVCLYSTGQSIYVTVASVAVAAVCLMGISYFIYARKKRSGSRVYRPLTVPAEWRGVPLRRMLHANIFNTLEPEHLHNLPFCTAQKRFPGEWWVYSGWGFQAKQNTFFAIQKGWCRFSSGIYFFILK